MKHLEYLVTCMILNNKVLRSFLNLKKNVSFLIFNGNSFYDVGVAMEKVLSPYVFDLKEGRVNLPSLVRKMTSCLSYLNIANTSS